jgi:glycosyl transferase family 2
MPDLTICIPAAPYHKEAVNHAVASVQAQTMPCQHLVFEDHDMRGAGYARNQLLRRVNTQYVTFLDADDILEPDFVQKCFLILEQVAGNRYVYTNWYEGDTIKVAPSPCDLWTQQTYHLVTTVMRTADARRIGGYDEQMPGAEDTDFGIRLKLSGVCGIHLNAPLLHYRVGGKRSIELRNSGREVLMQQYMRERYGEYTMGCCGESVVQSKPDGEKHDGDVMAMALWAGNRQERGRVTGRIYPRASKPKVVYVDPLDVAASPQLWQKVSAMPNSQPPILMPQYQQPSPLAQPGDWRAAGQAAFGGGQSQMPQQAASQDWSYKPVANNREIADKLKIGQRKSE